MIGLTIAMIKMMLWGTMACLDVIFLACTLGKVDPRTRKFFR